VPTRDVLLTALVIAVWGLNFVVIKVGTDAWPPLLLVTVRFALVAALVVPFFPRIDVERLKWVALLSVTFGSLHFALLFAGVSGVDAATAAVLIQLGVPFATLLAVAFQGDRLGPWRAGGLVLAFAGAAVLAGEPTLPDLGPFLLLVGAALGWAVSNLLVRSVPQMNPLALTGWMSLLAVPQVALWSLLFEDDHLDAFATAGWVGWGAALYVAVMASIVAYSTWYGLLARHRVSALVPFTLVAPVIGMAGGVTLLGEALTVNKVAGGALTIVGVGVIMWRQSRRDDPPAEDGRRA